MKVLGWFVAALVGMLVLIALVVLLAGWGMRQSEAFQMAEQKILTDARVQEAVGAPVKIAWFVMGSVERVGADGKADLALPISGSLGEADVDVHATLRNGSWTLDELSLRQRDAEPIDLLAAP